jgi:hypothetical protein
MDNLLPRYRVALVAWSLGTALYPWGYIGVELIVIELDAYMSN